MHAETRHGLGMPLGDWLSAFLSPKYLPMGLALYTAMFVVLQFVLLLFNAVDTSARWAFELTPAFLLDLPDIQLAFLGALVAGAEAYLQYGTEPRQRTAGMALAGLMAASLVMGMYNAGTDPAGANPMRLVMLVVVLAIVVLDHRGIVSAGPVEGARAQVPTQPIVPAPPAAPINLAAEDADLEQLLEEIDQETRSAVAAAAPESELVHGLEELMTLAEEEAMAEEPWAESEEELEEEAEFALRDLDAFEHWIDKQSEETQNGTNGTKKETRNGTDEDRKRRGLFGKPKKGNGKT